MKQYNTIGVDLAKHVIQVAVVSPNRRRLLNKSLTRTEFNEFLAKQNPALVAFEACTSAHCWARSARQQGHQVKILPAISVAPFRQGHKTDENDALAVAQAANRPNIKVAPLKALEQQGLQSNQRSRDLLVRDRTALSNHIRGLLMEFGLVIAKGFHALHQALPGILEEAENGMPDIYRPKLTGSSSLAITHQRQL